MSKHKPIEIMISPSITSRKQNKKIIEYTKPKPVLTIQQIIYEMRFRGKNPQKINQKLNYHSRTFQNKLLDLLKKQQRQDNSFHLTQKYQRVDNGFLSTRKSSHAKQLQKGNRYGLRRYSKSKQKIKQDHTPSRVQPCIISSISLRQRPATSNQQRKNLDNQNQIRIHSRKTKIRVNSNFHNDQLIIQPWNQQGDDQWN